jgi:tetratricopeptide (TPR) repeat protein
VKWRWGVFALLALTAAFVAWRIVGVIRSDAALDDGRVGEALRWRPQNPEALARAAAQARNAGDGAAAAALARQLLAHSPADGRGYRLLAQIAADGGDVERARALFAIAARRAPRDLETRAWLVEDAISRQDAEAALHHIDSVLLFAPGAGERLYPLLGGLSADPGFAAALARRLAEHPPWRGRLLASLQHARRDDPAALDRILAAMHARGGLDEAEFQAWIEGLMEQGRWGEAHARWASREMERGRPVALLYNGDLTQEPSGSGFDWRISKIPGMLPTVERGASGGVLRLDFLGRRLAAGPLVQHALLLPPGRYALAWSERTDALRATAGLRWLIACDGSDAPLVQAEPSDGTRPRRERTLVFTVPAGGCERQWLRLATGGTTQGGQVIGGQLWFSHARLVRDDGNM